MTIYDRFGRFEGLKVVIAGDISHSRVARSNQQAEELVESRSSSNR